MALGSAGSLRVASSSHGAKSRSGSSAAVKSPAVNPAWVFNRSRFGHVCGVPVWPARWLAVRFGPHLIVERAVASLRLAALCWRLRCGRWAAARCPRLDVQQVKDKDDARAYASEDVTGSVATGATPASASTAGLPSETDLVFARMAIVDVLDARRQGDQRALGKSAHRRARHRHPDRQRLRPRTAPPAATSWRAMCAGRDRRPGCRARPAAPSRAPGRSRACGPGRGPDAPVLSSCVAVERDQSPHIARM